MKSHKLQRDHCRNYYNFSDVFTCYVVDFVLTFRNRYRILISVMRYETGSKRPDEYGDTFEKCNKTNNKIHESFNTLFLYSMKKSSIYRS